MSQTSRTAAITLRCPLDLVNSIDDQVKQTRQNKTDVILGMLLSSEELNNLKKEFNNTLSTLVQFGSESIVKKLKNHLPPRGLQKWKPNSEDQKDGINRSSLAKHFGFNTVKDLEDAASLFDIDPINYLEELSGWKYYPQGEGNPSPKFKPIN